jgi:5-methylcytosine-specific restriction enzyme A
MPTRPPRACPRAACPHVTPCPVHSARAVAQTQHDETRGNSAARGYDHAWRKLRAQVLLDEPMCRMCEAAGFTEPATDVDHIVPHVVGEPHDRDNLQPLCHAHHSSKTARERGARGGAGAATTS